MLRGWKSIPTTLLQEMRAHSSTKTSITKYFRLEAKATENYDLAALEMKARDLGVSEARSPEGHGGKSDSRLLFYTWRCHHPLSTHHLLLHQSQFPNSSPVSDLGSTLMTSLSPSICKVPLPNKVTCWGTEVWTPAYPAVRSTIQSAAEARAPMPLVQAAACLQLSEKDIGGHAENPSISVLFQATFTFCQNNSVASLLVLNLLQLSLPSRCPAAAGMNFSIRNKSDNGRTYLKALMTAHYA